MRLVALLLLLALLPSCGDSEPEADVTVAQANVCGGRCNNGAESAVDAVARAASHADVVALNEACLPQVRRLAKALDLQLAFSATMPAPAECGGTPYGNALLARSLTDVSEEALPFPRVDPSGVVETRTILCARTSVGRACVTHLTPARAGPEEGWHGAQLEEVRAVAADAAIVVGDINTDSLGTGVGPNRVLVGEGLRATEVRRVRQPRSDHPAVVVELRRR